MRIGKNMYHSFNSSFSKHFLLMVERSDFSGLKRISRVFPTFVVVITNFSFPLFTYNDKRGCVIRVRQAKSILQGMLF